MESLEVEIAPRENYNDLLSHDLMLHLIERRRSEGTGWFRDDPFLMEKLEHRGTDSILMDGEYLEIICLRDREISLTDALHTSTIHEGLDLLEGDILMRFEGSEHGRCSLRFHSDNVSIRTKSMECRDQTTHESSPSDRTEDNIRTHISESFIDLESDTSLSGDDTLIIEWMDEYRARRFLVLFRLSKCIIEGISDENNFYVFSTELLGFVDFLLGSESWHEDLPMDAEFRCTIGDSLGMIARTGCDDTTFFLIFTESRHAIVRSTDLV